MNLKPLSTSYCMSQISNQHPTTRERWFQFLAGRSSCDLGEAPVAPQRSQLAARSSVLSLAAEPVPSLLHDLFDPALTHFRPATIKIIQFLPYMLNTQMTQCKVRKAKLVQRGTLAHVDEGMAPHCSFWFII